MADPWDRPPFAKHGTRQRTLYEAVGRALMNWEDAEGVFAHLYSAMLTGTRFNTQANQEYGEPLNFVHRMERLKTGACRYFQKHCSQDFEGEFDQIAKLALGWSGRRNDVAHGRARPSGLIIKADQGTNRWCVIPPHFRGEKFDGETPAYILSSREIRRFAEAFSTLARRVNDLAWMIESARST